MGAPDGGKRPVCVSMTTWKGCLCVPAYGACRRWLCIRLPPFPHPNPLPEGEGPFGVGEAFGVNL